ncbi:MAG TPA: hypothetical protein ENK88_03290 [Campylobacterales bacterium]|nr:hypothetical protein [Campylobacterales bacterium]
MSKFKLEFTLKQHTPIIHFQSNQIGATLRATELKPKLDKFLIEQFEKSNIDYKTFLISGQDRALDYKIKIETIGKPDTKLPNNFLFFSNNVIKKDRDKTKMLKTNSIKVELFSFKTSLIKEIEKYIDDFFLITNFGARSSKGYGGFTTKENNIEHIFKKYYPIVFKLSSTSKSWENDVDTIHKKLKSGINFKTYYKSLLFQYMCTKNIRWEKRKIKQEFPQLAKSKNGHSPIDCNTKFDFRYVRAMLGLAGINEYQGKQVVNITHKDKKIDRFQSPITYKVINRDIYILCDRSYQNIMDKEFTFKLKGKSFNIKTPSQNEFDLYEFLKFVEKHENLIREVK